PLAELSTAITARMESTVLFQPAIVPSSVANNCVAGAEFAPDVMTKPGGTLVVIPVGADSPVLFPGAGIVTVRGGVDGSACPVPSKVFEFPEPLFAIQIPLLTPSVIPQGFTRFVSVFFAMPATSAMRFVCVKVGFGGGVSAGGVCAIAMAETTA